MKKLLKKEIIISFIIGVIFASSIVVYATMSAKDVAYKDGKSVEYALNDLYAKTNKQSVQVATLTSQNATYTMQNDGYILGTAKFGTNGTMARLFLDDKMLALSNWESDDPNTYYVSVYATSGTVVRTRSDGGRYDLIVYEFK